MQVIRHLNHNLDDVVSIIDLTPEEAGWVHNPADARGPLGSPEYQRWIAFLTEFHSALAGVL